MSEQHSELFLDDQQVNDLVEHFYNKLIMLPYYRNMFADRGIDLDQLKERQRYFIKQLVNNDTLNHDSSEVHQIQHRHHFETTPERARTWLETMEEAIEEMSFSSEVEAILKEKMHYLTNMLLTKDLAN